MAEDQVGTTVTRRVGADSSVYEDGTPRINPRTGRQYHPMHSRVDREVQDRIEGLFDHLLSEFVYLHPVQVSRGQAPMKPSEIKEVLREWDLEDAFEEWWYEGKTDEELENEPWE